MAKLMRKVKQEQKLSPFLREGYVREEGKRFIWLTNLIRENNLKIGAEIGCHRGATTSALLRRNPDLKLIAVDLWADSGSVQYKDWNFKSSKSSFDARVRLYTQRVIVLQGLSWEMAEKVNDNSLDFVFIDADHEYESVVKDIKAWTPKVKDDGFVTGHDTHFKGVYEAINELIPNWKPAGIDHVWYCKKGDVLL